MFRTMQTSSAACALCAVGALAGAVAWLWRPWASGAPRSALSASVCTRKAWGPCTPFPQQGGSVPLAQPGAQLQPPCLAPPCSPSTMLLVQEWPGWTWDRGHSRCGQTADTAPLPSLTEPPTEEPVGAAAPSQRQLLSGSPWAARIPGRGGFLWSGARSPWRTQPAACAHCSSSSHEAGLRAGSNRGFQRELLHLRSEAEPPSPDRPGAGGEGTRAARGMPKGCCWWEKQYRASPCLGAAPGRGHPALPRCGKASQQSSRLRRFFPAFL